MWAYESGARIVNPNHTPDQAGIVHGQTVTLVKLAPWDGAPKPIRVTRPDQDPDGKDGDEDERKNITGTPTKPTTKGQGSASINTGRKVKRSETDECQLLKCYMHVDVRGRKERVLVELDTHSNCTYISDAVALPRRWNPGEERGVVGLGNYVVSTAPRKVVIYAQGKRVTLPGRREPGGKFRDETQVLLSKKHMRELNIDVNAAMSGLRHMDVQFLDCKQAEKAQAPSQANWNPDKAPKIKITRAKRKAKPTQGSAKKRAKANLTGQRQCRTVQKLEHVLHAKICRLAEKMMQAYLAKTGGTSKQPKQVSWEDVIMGAQLTPDQVQQARTLVKTYQDIFMTSPDDIPPALDVEPVEWQLKEGGKPVRCRKPNWGPAQRAFLTHWTRKALKQGLIVRADKSEWASRPVLVPKYRGDTPKGAIPDDIRVCIDYITVNERIKRLVDQYPDPQELLRKAAGHKYYFTADVQKQFNSVPLKAGKTQEMTTFWTPLGLMKYTRLIMGAKNASAIAQAIFARYLAEDLSEDDLDRIINFQDDYCGFEDEWGRFLQVLEAFFKMCRKNKVHINPAKVHIGASHAMFYGYKISKQGLEPAEKNLDPIRKLTAPTNRSEVRSLLGLFVQFRRFFERYDRLVAPIQQLLRKDKKFQWGKEQQNALDKMKAHITQKNIYLAAVDKTKKLILETDGSDDGWGAILLQIINGERRVIGMWSGRWKTVVMRKSPPYYKETKAWMNGLEKARVYVDTHPMPITCITDHIPLTWIKNTSGKGPVSQFILDNLSYLDYELKYRPGKQLVQADAVSRYPCLGPKTLTDEGKMAAVKALFDHLPKQWEIGGRTWIYTGKDSQLAREAMINYQTNKSSKRVPLTDNPSPAKIASEDYAFAVFASYSDTVTKVLDTALEKDRPFACLVPISLVGKAPSNEINKTRLQEATKIVLLDPEMVWVLHKVPQVTSHQVQARDLHHMDIESEGLLAKQPDLKLNRWPAM